MAARSLPESVPGPVSASSLSLNEIKPRVRSRADGLWPKLDHLENWCLCSSEPHFSP